MGDHRPEVKGNIYGKLSFYEGWPDRVISKLVGATSEKVTGLQMIRQIMDNFAISMRDIVLDIRKRQLEERGLFRRRN